MLYNSRKGWNVCAHTIKHVCTIDTPSGYSLYYLLMFQHEYTATTQKQSCDLWCWMLCSRRTEAEAVDRLTDDRPTDKHLFSRALACKQRFTTAVTITVHYYYYYFNYWGQERRIRVRWCSTNQHKHRQHVQAPHSGSTGSRWLMSAALRASPCMHKKKVIRAGLLSVWCYIWFSCSFMTWNHLPLVSFRGRRIFVAQTTAVIIIGRRRLKTWCFEAHLLLFFFDGCSSTRNQ